MQDKEIMTVKEVAKWLGVSESHVYQMIYRNEIPHFRVGKAIRFHRERMEDWAKGGTKEVV